ncbi:MAG: hypothetical protein QOH17_2674 [Pseudonocardiales bacterium]|nr:hypothetical protein [Pseudonocardiales bacterium]
MSRLVGDKQHELGAHAAPAASSADGIGDPGPSPTVPLDSPTADEILAKVQLVQQNIRASSTTTEISTAGSRQISYRVTGTLPRVAPNPANRS